ncbi:MAG: FtsX-like permease family protein [Candidatus Moranbacteria bacterium]|jgi:ABC-type antimicrobial peptide transport system permease subunit|nr:FtsX-like permease family protein [Candidatus Moranbacteria bacterium]
MLALDTIRISARSFKNNRLRTFLTVTGISVGIASIFFLVSLGYGFQKVVLERIATSDSLLSIDVYPKVDKNGGAGVISDKDLPEIEKVEGVLKMAPIITQKFKIHSSDFTTEAKVNIVNADFFKLEGIVVQKGDVFSDESKNEIVVTSSVLDLLHIDSSDFRNKEIVIDISTLTDEERKNSKEDETVEKKYRVIGMINDKSKANVYVSSASVNELGFDYFNRIKIRVDSEGKIGSVRDNITQKGYIVSAISDTVDQTRKIFKVIQIVLLSFGMLALIVSAIGMFNTMTISLLERTQEIAIMKSLGASAQDIWGMFLTESVLIGFLGGAIGIVIGFGGTEVFNLMLNLIAENFGGISVDIFYIPLWFVIFIVIFSTVVGLVTGFYPAKRAAALDTLEALRYK